MKKKVMLVILCGLLLIFLASCAATFKGLNKEQERKIKLVDRAAHTEKEKAKVDTLLLLMKTKAPEADINKRIKE